MPSQAFVHPLQAERQGCLTQATLIVAKAKREGRDLTDDEAKQADSLIAKAEALKTELLSTRQTAPPSLADFGGGGPSPRITGLFGGDGASVADRLFGAKHTNDGFASFGEFLATLDSGRYDQRMRAANREGIDSEGGFLVPATYQNAFIDAVVENTILASRVRKFPMSSDVLNLSGFDGNNHTSTLFGGLAAAWETELPSLSEQSPKTRRISFLARKLMILTQASNEIVSDADGYERMLGTALVQAVAWQLDYALFRGTGAGQPLGIIHADSRIEVNAVANQTASTIWYRNLVDMFARLHPASYNNAIWCCNPTCIPQLMTLDAHADTAGSTSLVGDSRYEPFKESNGKFSLFGRQVEVSEKLPALGTAGDIVLVDPSQYGLAMRQEVVVEKSTHAGFTSDSSYYRAKLRCDGRPLWASAMKPNAGDDLSWCVTLAARAD